MSAVSNRKFPYFKLYINNLSNNYDKNTIDPVLMADCNSPSVKISRFGKDTLNSTYTEGIATPTEGLILTAYPKRSTWNSQMALPNGVNARPYVRGVSANSWSKWKEVTLKDDFKYIDVRIATSANNSIVITGAPKSSEYIPVIVAHKETNNCQDTVVYDGGTWKICSTVSQETGIRFYHMPIS